MPPKRSRKCCTTNALCEECLRKKAVREARAAKKKADNCRGEHDVESVVQLRQSNPALYQEAYSGKDAPFERITDGPFDVYCDVCKCTFSNYAMKWANTQKDYGWGPGVTIVGTLYLNGADAIRQYHEELEVRAREESARAIADKDRQNEVIVEQLEELEEFANNPDLMVVKVLDVVSKEVRKNMNGLEEEEEDEKTDEETEGGGIRLGEDAQGKRRKRRRGPRGGAAFKDWKQKEMAKKTALADKDEGGSADAETSTIADNVSISTSTAMRGMKQFAAWRMQKKRLN